MNESLRVKEDFSHLNAIVGAMRIQLHWLMTTRLQNQQRAGAMSGPNNSSSSGGSAGYGNGGSSLSMLGSQPLRRLSGMLCVSQETWVRGLTFNVTDTIRQDTKL